MKRWLGLVVPLALIGGAQVGLSVSGFRSDNVAAPLDVVIAFARGFADFSIPFATLQTLSSALGGLSIGVSLGLVCGVTLGLFPVVSQLTSVSIEVFRPIPSVALIPVSLLVFGYGYPMEIAIVAFATFWPVIIYSRSAIENVELRLLEIARALQFSVLQTVWKIVLPAALPRLFVAVRISVAISLIISVTVEITTNPQGLGHALMTAQQSLRPDVMFAKLAWLGVLGVAINFQLLWIQRSLFGNAGRIGGVT